jgi:CYTH domain-containing protein
MKAIINVNKESAYAKYNGHTFEVKEFLSTVAGIKIPHEEFAEVTADFSHTEVLIVDLQEELQKAYDNYNWGGDNRTFPNLMSYVKTNNFVMRGLKYNCPA